jgi:hypothetical protein
MCLTLTKGVRMIIVEGPDGAGKTNMVNKLMAIFNGLELMPKAVSSEEAKALRPIGPYVEEELAKKFGLRVYDRFALISSPMYLSLPNPTFVEPMTDVQWLMMQYSRLNRIDPVIIYCMPPLAVVKANMETDTETPDFVKERIETIYNSYVAFIARTYSASHMIWDYTNPTMHRVDALMRWAKARVEKGRVYAK